MTTALLQVQPFTYTNPQGLKLEVLFVLDLDKKGYINATAIAKQFGREPIHWLRNNSVEAYIQALLEQMNQIQTANSKFGTKTIVYDDLTKSANSPTSLRTMSYDDLVLTNYGAPENNGGTWLHPKLGVVFARWLSPHFAVWCDEQITKLLRQNSEQQRQFPELSLVFDAIERSRQESHQRFHEMEQRFETTEKMLNRFHEQLAQDGKNTMGRIYLNINQIHKILRQQQQVDLPQPPVQDTIKQTIVDYQQVLEQMLRGHQDELIQTYLVGIKENLERISQRFPETILKTQLVALVTEIEGFRTAGESWNHIAQCLNERGIATPSGKGKWYGSSVKRYVELQQQH